MTDQLTTQMSLYATGILNTLIPGQQVQDACAQAQIAGQGIEVTLTAAQVGPMHNVSMQVAHANLADFLAALLGVGAADPASPQTAAPIQEVALVTQQEPADSVAEPETIAEATEPVAEDEPEPVSEDESVQQAVAEQDQAIDAAKAALGRYRDAAQAPQEQDEPNEQDSQAGQDEPAPRPRRTRKPKATTAAAEDSAPAPVALGDDEF